MPRGSLQRCHNKPQKIEPKAHAPMDPKNDLNQQTRKATVLALETGREAYRCQQFHILRSLSAEKAVPKGEKDKQLQGKDSRNQTAL